MSLKLLPNAELHGEGVGTSGLNSRLSDFGLKKAQKESSPKTPLRSFCGFCDFCGSLLLNPSLFVVFLFFSSLSAATWQWTWVPAPGDPVPEVEIMLLKYGKSRAYAVEIDDGPVSTLTVSQPLLANYAWNDAPPGIAGGQDHPFVGGAAVVVGGIARNRTSLNWEQLAELKTQGWSILNHSYWHSGVHWDKEKMNTPEEFRRELFWSQAVLATLIGEGRTSSHFVYPNGDYNYGPYLKEFGLRSGSRTHGSSPRNLRDPKLNLLNFTRNYLDEKPWKSKNDPLHGLPDAPAPGDFIIDFTHGMKADPESDNHKRWVERLDHIATAWGPRGDNSLWVAPTDEVFDYVLATRAATVNIDHGTLTLEVSEDAPGSALTVKLTGVGAEALMNPPEGGSLYRDGDTVWITTPVIGERGVPGPPGVQQLYAGEAVDLQWEKAVTVAGVRVLHQGKHAQGPVKLELVDSDGKVKTLFDLELEEAKNTWGWKLYYIVPDQPAFSAASLRITADKSLQGMEVWSISEE